MNSDILVRKSQTHGLGVFANRKFKKGETIIRHDISNEITRENYNKLNAKEKLFVSIIKGKYIIMQSPSKYVNHSCNPNMKSKNNCDIAIKDIEKGEELSVDYSNEIPEGESRLCKCLSKNCRGVIKKT